MKLWWSRDLDEIRGFFRQELGSKYKPIGLDDVDMRKTMDPSELMLGKVGCLQTCSACQPLSRLAWLGDWIPFQR